MSALPIVVLGTGGHASVVVELVRAAGRTVQGCVGPQEPSFGEEYCRYLGNDDAIEALGRAKVELTVGVGAVAEPALRQRLFEDMQRRGYRFAILKHAQAFVAESAALSEGCQIMAMAAVQSHARVENNVIINTGAVVEHHAQVGEHAHIAPGAVVCGAARIGAGTLIGANATVIQGVQVGAGCIVAAGACVVRDVPDGLCVKGVPAS